MFHRNIKILFLRTFNSCYVSVEALSPTFSSHHRIHCTIRPSPYNSLSYSSFSYRSPNFTFISLCRSFASSKVVSSSIPSYHLFIASSTLFSSILSSHFRFSSVRIHDIMILWMVLVAVSHSY